MGHAVGANGNGNGVLVEDETDDDVDTGTRIVKSKSFAIKPMVASEAAEQMGILGHDFFLFTNADTGRAAVVYRRADGDVGLIDHAG